MKPQQFQKPQQAGYTTYYPAQASTMTDMLNAIMPLMMLMMMMAMIMPMMKGITAAA